MAILPDISIGSQIAMPQDSFANTATLSPPEAGQSKAEGRWENEGGRVGHGMPQDAFLVHEIRRLTEEAERADTQLSSDFANGRVGTRYNTLAHRTRIVRRLVAERDALRDTQIAIQNGVNRDG